VPLLMGISAYYSRHISPVDLNFPESLAQSYDPSGVFMAPHYMSLSQLILCITFDSITVVMSYFSADLRLKVTENRQRHVVHDVVS